MIVETETMAAFARRNDVSPTTVRLWVDRGLPCGEQGRVRIHEGLRWVEKLQRIPRPRPTDGFEQRKSFARRTGVTPKTVRKWTKRGLPCDEHGHVAIAAGQLWVADKQSRETTWRASSQNRATFRASVLKEMKGACQQKLFVMLQAARIWAQANESDVGEDVILIEFNKTTDRLKKRGLAGKLPAVRNNPKTNSKR